MAYDAGLSSQQLLQAGAPADVCHGILDILADAGQRMDVAEVWRRVSKYGLTPHTPFTVHKLVAAAVFREWDEAVLGPHPVWVPSAAGAAGTNLATFMRANPHLLDTASESRIVSPRQAFPTPRIPQKQGQSQGSPESLARDFARLHAASVEGPERFWPPVLQQLGVKWARAPTSVLALEGGHDPDACRWFPGALVNIAQVALWGRDPDAAAIVYATEAAPRRVRTITYGELRRRATAVAKGLLALGLRPGDAVAIAMPMTPDAVAAYLGIVLMGGAVVSIAESFSSDEMASRLSIAHTRAVFTQLHEHAAAQEAVLRGGKALPLYSRIAQMPQPRPRAIVLPRDGAGEPAARLEPGDFAWQLFLRGGAAVPSFIPHIADPYETTNVLFSSGTTGEPKAIPWTHLTPLRAGVDAWSCHDLRRGDVILWPTSLGWMMGPWLVYAALLNSCAIGLFLGSPVTRAFGEFVESARVGVVGLVPSIAKAWRASGCMDGLDWGCVRCFSSSGEASSPDDAHWLMARAGYKPILEYCGGTEVGGAFCSSTLLHASVPSAFATLTLGMDVYTLPDDSARDAPSAPGGPLAREPPFPGGGVLTSLRARVPGRGEIALRAPALGMSQTLLNREHGTVYYQGMPALEHPALGAALPLRRHGDEFEVLPGGYYRALGRVDDTMNLGGIKVSSVELERACVKHVDAVVQAAAVACPAAGGGPDRLVMFVVLRDDTGDLHRQGLQAQVQEAIRSHLNPLFKVHDVLVRPSLPVNASSKVMRRVLRSELEQAGRIVSRL